jgi:hypothetical protein
MKQLINITLLLASAGSAILSQPIIVENGPASSAVTVSVILPAKAKIVSASPVAPFTISAADIKHGSKDIPAAASLTIWSNARNGFVLSSRLVSLTSGDGSAAAGILVLGQVAGGPQFQPQMMDFQDLYQGMKAEKNLTGLSVDLKLLIDPGTKPGQYRIEPEFNVSCR